jgi:hypothetical protein
VVALNKIYKGETPLGELQNAFKTEIKGMLEDAALRLKCNIEQLKYRFDNLGQVEVQKMTIEEMVVKSKEDQERKRIASIRSRRN